MSNTSEVKAHPFELAGMGTGPFRFVGIVSLPSPSLAEANPFAYQNACQECAHVSKSVSGGLGSCRNCGMPIMHNCLVKNAQGITYAVGSDCVLKTGDQFLGDKVKVAVARMQAEARREKKAQERHARHESWLSSVCNGRGETNAQRMDRELNEQAIAKKVREQKQLSRLGFLLPILDAESRTDGDFCYNMAARIRNGNELTGRPLEIVGEIYARQHGRRGNKGYEEALEEFWKAVDAKA